MTDQPTTDRLLPVPECTCQICTELREAEQAAALLEAALAHSASQAAAQPEAHSDEQDAPEASQRTANGITANQKETDL